MDAKQHFWGSEGIKNTSFPGTSVKVSSFCPHNSATLVVLCFQDNHMWLYFSTAVPQGKCPRNPAPLQISGEVTCSLAYSPMELLCCTKGDFVKAAFQKPLGKTNKQKLTQLTQQGLLNYSRCLECNTAVNEACRNGTKLSLNSIWLTFHLRAVHYASVSLCTQQKCIYSSTHMVMEERAAQVPFVMMMWPKESSRRPSSKMLSFVCSCKRCRVWSHHPCPWKSPQFPSDHSATWNQRLVTPSLQQQGKEVTS